LLHKCYKVQRETASLNAHAAIEF